MIRTKMKINGMRCGMCEAQVCDLIRNTITDAAEVSASHEKGMAVFLTEERVDEESLKAVIDAAGFTCTAIVCGPYNKNAVSLIEE